MTILREAKLNSCLQPLILGFAGFGLTLLSGCGPDCTKTPNDPQCQSQLPNPADGGGQVLVFPDAGPGGDIPDATIAATLTYTKLKRELGECGESTTSVAWTFTGQGAPSDGWIIQRIVDLSNSRQVFADENECRMPGAVPLLPIYYEAWKIEEGERIPAEFNGIDYWVHSSAAFTNNISQNYPNNLIYVRGEAIFWPGDLPNTFQRGQVAQAGPAYATLLRPPFWNDYGDEEKLVREQALSFQCCDENFEKQTFVCLDTHEGIDRVQPGNIHERCEGIVNLLSNENTQL